MRILVVGFASLFTAGVLWIGGELHRKNCISQKRVGCSVLPWVSGHVPPLSRLACQDLLLRISAGAATGPLPTECR